MSEKSGIYYTKEEIEIDEFNDPSAGNVCGGYQMPDYRKIPKENRYEISFLRTLRKTPCDT